MGKAESIVKNIFLALGEIAYVTSVSFSRDSLSRKMMRLDPGYREWEMRQELKRLQRNGCIKERGDKIEITKKGSARINYYRIQELSFDPAGKAWDHQWRIIMFDIPEKRRIARKILRNKLKEWDCTKLQQSVFITPHVCNEELQKLINIIGIRQYVHVIPVPSLGEHLKKKFERKYRLD